MPTSKPAREAYMQGRADKDRGRLPRNIPTLAYLFGDDQAVYYWYSRGYEE